MVELLKDSRALQALLQKLRDLPSPVSANPRPKTHQWVECPQRRLEVLGYSFLRFQNIQLVLVVKLWPTLFPTTSQVFNGPISPL